MNQIIDIIDAEMTAWESGKNIIYRHEVFTHVDGRKELIRVLTGS